jgi:hypothetical protein
MFRLIDTLLSRWLGQSARARMIRLAAVQHFGVLQWASSLIRFKGAPLEDVLVGIAVRWTRCLTC